MRVNDSNLNSVTSGTHETAQTTAVGGSRGSSRTARSGSGGDDHVQLSLGAQFHELALNSPEHESRISNIAAAYANGSYQPNSQAVSKRIVSDAFGPR